MNIKVYRFLTAATAFLFLNTGWLAVGDSDYKYTAEIVGGGVYYNTTEEVYDLILSPEQKTTFQIKINNMNVEDENYQLSISGAPEDWLVIFENQEKTTSLYVGKGSSNAVTVIIKPTYEGSCNISFRIDSLTEGNGLTIVLNLTSETPAIRFKTPKETLNAPVGTSIRFNFTIENLISTKLYVVLSLDGIKEGNSGLVDEWVAQLSRNNLSIDGGQEATISITVFVPRNTTTNQPVVFNIVAQAPQKGSIYHSDAIRINPENLYILKVSYSGGEIRTFPGEKANFTINVENLADRDDTITATFSSLPLGWDVKCLNAINPLIQPVVISSREQLNFFFRVTLPSKVPAGYYTVVLSFTGTKNQTSVDIPFWIFSSQDIELINGPDLIEAPTKYYPIKSGENTVELILDNRGNTYENVSLRIVSMPSGWKCHIKGIGWGTTSSTKNITGASLNTTTLPPADYFFKTPTTSDVVVYISPYLSARVYIYVQAKSGEGPGMYHMAVRITYSNGNRIQVLPIDMKLILAEVVFEDLNGDTKPDVEVKPNGTIRNGDWITISCRIKNVYPYPVDNFKAVLDIGENKRVKVVNVAHLNPGEEKNISFRWRAIEGVYTVRIHLESPSIAPEEEPSVYYNNLIINEQKLSASSILGPVLILLSGIILLGAVFYLQYKHRKEGKELKEREREESYRKVYGKSLPKGRRGGKKKFRELEE